MAKRSTILTNLEGNLKFSDDSLACKLSNGLSTTAPASLIEKSEHLSSSSTVSKPLPVPAVTKLFYLKLVL